MPLSRFLPKTLFLTFALHMAMSNQAHAALPECVWMTSAGPMEYTVELGQFWVPRDAEIGTIIGPPYQHLFTDDSLRREIRCDNDATGVLTFDMSTLVPLYGGTLPPINGFNVNGKVMETGIPGVGLHMRLDFPLSHIATNAFQPRTDSAVPYAGWNPHNILGASMRITYLYAYYTLIKIGPIPAGPQSFNRPMTTGVMSDLGTTHNVRIKGQVIQAQCTLKADAVSADPVELGTHIVEDFTGVGSATASVPFHITLSDCDEDPTSSVARAHIRLDGANGSSPLDPAMGLFSLTSNSTASGIGIQLLRSDGTPMELEKVMAVAPLSVGDVRLDFQARYYQTDPLVRAGSADGALNFTISYR